MNIYLRPEFGVSTDFYTSDEQPFEGADQGNGAAPELWLIISIFLIRHLYQQKLVTSITTPISKFFQLLTALLYVEDTDIYVFDSGYEITQDIVAKYQILLYAWNEALKFTGGDLNLLNDTGLYKTIHGKT